MIKKLPAIILSLIGFYGLVKGFWGLITGRLDLSLRGAGSVITYTYPDSVRPSILIIVISIVVLYLARRRYLK